MMTPKWYESERKFTIQSFSSPSIKEESSVAISLLSLTDDSLGIIQANRPRIFSSEWNEKCFSAAPKLSPSPLCISCDVTSCNDCSVV